MAISRSSTINIFLTSPQTHISKLIPSPLSALAPSSPSNISTHQARKLASANSGEFDPRTSDAVLSGVAQTQAAGVHGGARIKKTCRLRLSRPDLVRRDCPSGASRSPSESERDSNGRQQREVARKVLCGLQTRRGCVPAWNSRDLVIPLSRCSCRNISAASGIAQSTAASPQPHCTFSLQKNRESFSE